MLLLLTSSLLMRITGLFSGSKCCQTNVYDSDLTIGSDNGESSGVGTTCIKDPNDGTCGCENSDGTFVHGGTNCK
jgi:hypothetical protein